MGRVWALPSRAGLCQSAEAAYWGPPVGDKPLCCTLWGKTVLRLHLTVVQTFHIRAGTVNRTVSAFLLRQAPFDRNRHCGLLSRLETVFEIPVLLRGLSRISRRRSLDWAVSNGKAKRFGLFARHGAGKSLSDNASRLRLGNGNRCERRGERIRC